MRYPFFRPTLPKFEDVEDQFRDVFDTGMMTVSKYAEEFEDRCKEYLEVKNAVAVSSGSIGLITALSLLPENSEVIIPGVTFSATVQALYWNRLKPVVVDVDDDANISVESAKEAITGKTSAILPVHLYGNPCDLKGLTEICDDSKIELITDAAHAFGTRYKGKSVGSFGKCEIFSLGVTKTIPVGEGGLITTQDDEFARKMRMVANNGREEGSINPSLVGLSGRFQELNGIIGLHVIKDMEERIRKRNMLAQHYVKRLSSFEGIRFPEIREGCRSSFKDFAMFIDKEKFGISRDELAAHLESRGIKTKFYFYPPVHRLDFCREELKDAVVPNAEKLSSTTISLPLYTHMTTEDIDNISDAVGGSLG